MNGTPETRTSIGTIEYREAGTGRPVVFVHGFLTNGNLWSSVAARLPPTLRAIRPDLPLGGHRVAARPEATLSLPELAGALLELLENLGLEDVTLVGNDTGGAICQVAITRDDARVRRIGRLVLTNCDAFEAFPPPKFKPVKDAARLNPRIMSLLTAQLLKTKVGRKRVLRNTAATHLSDSEALSLFGGFLNDRAIRRDAMKVLLGMSPDITLDAATHFRSFTRPVRLVWGVDDVFFPVNLGERLQNAFPNATLQLVEHAKLFVALDQPDAVAAAIIAA